MEITIKRNKIDDENSNFDINKSKDMTWLEALGVLEIAKKEILDMMSEE